MAEARVTTAEGPGLGPVEIGGRAIRVFSSPADEPRFRRATDVVVLVPALLALAILVALYPPGSFERASARWVGSIPGFTSPLWWFLYDLLLLWAIVLVATAVLAGRGFILLQAITAFAVALGLAVVSARLATGAWPDVADAVRGGTRGPAFPAVRLAEAAAVALTIGPHLVLPLQRVGRWLLGLAFVGAFVVDNAVPSGKVAGLLIAFVVAAAVRLALGTSAGAPACSRLARRCASSASARGASRSPTARTRACSSSRRGTRTGGRCSSRCTDATPTTTSCSRRCGERCGTRTAAPACVSVPPRSPSTRR